MSFLLGAAAFTFGMLPLTVSFSRTRLAQLSTFGVGLLLGAGLGVIIPEGIESVTPHGAEPPTHTIALSLLGGFAAMLAIEQLLPGHTHTHQPLPTHAPDRERGRQRTLSMASDNELDLDLEIELLETNASSRSAGAGGQDGRAKALPLSLGLVIHCAADGIALGASSVAGNEASALPLIVFLALAVHKAPTALALSTSLLAAGLPKPAVRKHLVVFSLASPVAAIGTFFALAFFGGSAAGIAAWTGIALLASGGSFLYVATVLQPVSSPGASEELGRLPRLALIVAGMFTPVLIASLIGHGH
ncbi:Zinc/iron permease [Auricularia subglabra TFB-10046 SS5]|nr:Zinc/iron permease [Auricularia subglabra TFB-10046 SS5]